MQPGKKMICRGATLIFVVVLTAGDIIAAQWQGSLETIGGMIHVMNPNQPMLSNEMVAPQELWRVGGDEEAEDQVLGFVTDVQVDEEGNSYLLDSTWNVIHVFSPEGIFLRDIGGEGEGPGEFQNVDQFMLMPDGTFGVVQMMPAKIITLDKQGVPGSYFSVCNGDQGLSLIEKAQAAGNQVVIGVGCANFSAMGVDYTLSFVDTDGTVRHTIREKTEVSANGSINVGGGHDCEFTQYWTLGSDGRVFISEEKDVYAIDVYNSEGVLERRIHREYQTVKRSKEDLAADRKRADEMTKKYGGMVQLQTREYERDIEEMYARSDGQVWVLSSQGERDCPKGAVGLFDVFDAEGRFLKQIGLNLDYNEKKDDFLLVDDLLFVLKQAKVRPASMSSNVSGGVATMIMVGGGNSEDDEEGDEVPPSVVCYRLP
jgi:hypothetical protein